MFNFYKIAGTRVGEEIEKLRSDDLSQEETMASLRLEIEALTEEKKFLKAEAISKIRTLERELALFKTTSSYDVINNERNALKDEISNLNKLVQISNEEKQIQITKLAALETEMMTIKTAASNTDREMNTRLNAERSLNESLKQEIIMLKHKCDDAMIKGQSNNKEKDMFNNTINDLRDKIRILEESANIEKSTRLTEDKSQKEMIEKCQSEIAKLNKENGAMRKEVETLRKENDKILKEKTAMDATIKELEKKVKDYDVEEKIIQRTDSMKRVDGEITARDYAVAAVKLQELEKDNLLLSNNIKEVTNKFEMAIALEKAEKEKSTNECLIATEKIIELEQQLISARSSFEETLKVTTDSLEKQIAIEKEEHEKLKNDYFLATEKINELENQLNLTRESFEETLKSTTDTLERRIALDKEKSEHEIIILRTKVSDLENQITLAQSSFEETLKTTTDTLETKIASEKAGKEKSTKDYILATEKIIELENQLTQAQSAYELKLKETTDTFEKKVAFENAEKEKAKNDYVIATEKISQLEKHMTSARSSFEETLKATTEMFENNFTEERVAKENFSKKYEEAKVNIAELEKQIISIKSNSDTTLKTTKESLEKIINTERKEKDLIVNERALAMEKIVKLEREINDLQKEHITSVEMITTLDDALSASKNSMEELVQELIATKMLYANNVMDADRDKMNMHKKLLSMAEKGAASFQMSSPTMEKLFQLRKNKNKSRGTNELQSPTKHFPYTGDKY